MTHDNANSYCYLWAPAELIDAEYALMPYGLKLSVRVNPDPVVLVGTIRFTWRRFWGPSPEDIGYLLA